MHGLRSEAGIQNQLCSYHYFSPCVLGVCVGGGGGPSVANHNSNSSRDSSNELGHRNRQYLPPSTAQDRGQGETADFGSHLSTTLGIL